MVQQQGCWSCARGKQGKVYCLEEPALNQLENQFARTTETLKLGKGWSLSLCSVPSWARCPQDHTKVQSFTRMTQDSEKLLYSWLFVVCDIERTQTQIHKRKWCIGQSQGETRYSIQLFSLGRAAQTRHSSPSNAV